MNASDQKEEDHSSHLSRRLCLVGAVPTFSSSDSVVCVMWGLNQRLTRLLDFFRLCMAQQKISIVCVWLHLHTSVLSSVSWLPCLPPHSSSFLSTFLCHPLYITAVASLVIQPSSNFLWTRERQSEDLWQR